MPASRSSSVNSSSLLDTSAVMVSGLPHPRSRTSLAAATLTRESLSAIPSTRTSSARSVCSRALAAMPFGRPPGLPLTPGWNFLALGIIRLLPVCFEMGCCAGWCGRRRGALTLPAPAVATGRCLAPDHHQPAKWGMFEAVRIMTLPAFASQLAGSYRTLLSSAQGRGNHVRGYLPLARRLKCSEARNA